MKVRLTFFYLWCEEIVAIVEQFLHALARVAWVKLADKNALDAFLQQKDGIMIESPMFVCLRAILLILLRTCCLVVAIAVKHTFAMVMFCCLYRYVVLDTTQEEVVAEQLLMVNPSYLIMVG